MLSLAAEKLNSLGRGLHVKAARNQFIACLAVLGLYLQLAAGAFCTAGLASADLGDFPICHAASADQSSAPKPDHAPQQQHSCAFCALHCHAALVQPPALRLADASAAATPQQPHRVATQPRSRLLLAAQPRGPPHLA